MIKILKTALVLCLLATLGMAQERMSPELLWKLKRVSGGIYSPDGKWVVHGVRGYDIKENKGDTDLFLTEVATGKSRQVTEGPGSEGAVQWAQTVDGARLFFLARRGDGATTQAWHMDPVSGATAAVTNEKTGIANLKVSPTAKHIAFTMDVKLDNKVVDIYPDLPKADARIIDGLMYRHWDAWHDYKYSHLHVAEIGVDLKAKNTVDLMENMKVDCPVPPFAGSEQLNWSPDGTEIAFTMKVSNDWAQSTDSDIYLIKVGDADQRKRCITAGMDGYDNDPIYSPDGKYLAFHSMKRPGFESDRNRLMIYDRKSGVISDLSAGLDQMVHGSVWAPDSSRLYFMSEMRGTNQLYTLDLASKSLKRITLTSQKNWGIRDIAPDGKTLLVGVQSMVRSTELGYLTIADGSYQPLTDVNGEIFSKLEKPKIEERWVKATDGKMIHSWVIYPPNFDPKKKWPTLIYFQGGPQGQIGQWFSFRWNFHLMAAQGYVVVAPNRRGLPGFGRAWNDEISKDWGGQAMQDILAVTDDVATEPFVDSKKMAGIGASFGGYTAYWMMGNGADRFAAMISHAGLFNLESMYGVTEELFFVNWDVGGPYWRSKKLQDSYNRFSPHRFVGNWKTPLLVIHGEKDFRVPIGEGMQAFTAAQLQGVPSRFLYFPEEGHWVQNPQNGVLWHRVFFDWLARYCKN
ncbi:MAG: dipeptidyl aminopeptidase/acylaminoacyl peptidase [Planctomycetota bacterium]|jgi:dipeptidyl aminopeptidase/acylaminoacyl peptidase